MTNQHIVLCFIKLLFVFWVFVKVVLICLLKTIQFAFGEICQYICTPKFKVREKL